jgi:hypothetical protein
MAAGIRQAGDKVATKSWAALSHCRAVAHRYAAEPALRLVERFLGWHTLGPRLGSVSALFTVSSKPIPNLVTINGPFRSIAPPSLGADRPIAVSPIRRFALDSRP